ncbi:magnesium-translocating P-type ATPase [Nannocystaceae bacterium ST9]
MKREFWALDQAELLRQFESDEAGLAPEIAARRLDQHGENRLGAARRGPFVLALISQLRNPLLWLLLVAAAISLAVGETTEALVVIAILMLGSSITMLQEGRAGHALERLRERIVLRARVVRAGVELEVPVTTIVPGDVVVLAGGSLVPADAVVLTAKELFLAESVLTGEAFPVEKRPGVLPLDTPRIGRTNMVHMGTSVRSGSGRALVVETGATTAYGQLAARLVVRAPDTEFQRGLRRFGYLLITIMLVLVVFVFTASALRSHPAIDSLLFAIALAVGLAPEMLPAVLATMLSRGARRMGARGVFVRRLEAIENLGNMDMLCTDKTGTLTEGEIQLDRAVDGAGRASPRVAELAGWNAALQTGVANPLDRAVLAARTSGEPPPNKLDELPFDFIRKRLSVLVELEGAPLLICKGAVEPVLGLCTHVREAEGRVAPLDAEALAALHERADAWGREGVRALAIASREQPERSISRADERELVFEGFLGFRDPLKAGVEQTIADLRTSGIAVKIVSGDHHAVVEHLAAQIGLPGEVVTGKQLAELHDDALLHRVELADAFAEVDPGQKERILRALQRGGHVVGFMGDGINDAPALHAADVGISVEGASDVAREAADFVLTRRDLGSVLAGVTEGRKTFNNTLKYILTTESANLGNMLSMAVATLFLPFLPLLAPQVLLNNLLSDVPSTMLSADDVDPEVLAKPRHWNLGFVRRFMIVFGLVSAVFDGLTFVLLTWVFDAGPELFRTAWFAESLLTELVVLLVLRTRRRFWRSRPHAALLISTGFVVLALVALLATPTLRVWLGFVALPGEVWAAIVAVAAGYVLLVEAIKRPVFAWLDGPTSKR